MRPKTKLQAEVWKLSESLPYMEKKVESFAFEKVIKHLGYRNKSRTGCLSCGHKWNGPKIVKRDICPNCNRRLIIEDTQRLKPVYRQMVYVSVLDVCGKFQVNRFFQFYVTQKVGTEPRIWGWEIVQQWIQPDGKDEVIARNRQGSNYYMTPYFSGDLEIRQRYTLFNKYNLWPDGVYPDKKILPIYKRNGFKGSFGVSGSYSLFNNILDNPRAETLLKARQWGLLDAALDNRGTINRFWNSIKICIRNKYRVKDPKTWFDYLDLLQQFGKDLNNIKYLRPANLKIAHDKLVKKRREIQRKRELEHQKMQLEKDTKLYLSEKQQYFGLIFTDGDLTIKVLESIQEFIAESDAHGHCVFTNKYYNKKDSLCFSASIAGVKMETIEVSLTNGQILQSRGLKNNPSIHNKRIINLMKQNINVVMSRKATIKKSGIKKINSKSIAA